MAIGFERDTFLFQEHALTAPSRSCAPLFVDNTVAGQLLGTWCITQGTSHHPGMAWPSSPGSNNTIGSNPSVRYLTDDIQHIITKLVRLFGSHSVWIKKFYLHLYCPLPLLYMILQRYNFSPNQPHLSIISFTPPPLLSILLCHSNKHHSNKPYLPPSQIALAISFSSRHCPRLIVIFSL